MEGIKGEMRKVGKKLNYNQKKILGRGNFGSVVYFGHFLLPDKYEHQVAVKRFQWSSVKKDSITHFNEEFIGLESKHLLRYFATEKTDEDFFYIITELCTGTLEKLVKGQYMGPPIGDIDEREILFQVSKGLDYLHSKKFVHGDIKPSNILIYFPSANDEKGALSTSVLFKLADYGIYSIIELDDKSLFKKQKKSDSNVFGTMGWRAPELYDSTTFRLPADIFALGCIFGYTLSGGRHPFGDCTLEQSIQIMEKEGMKLTKKDLKLQFSDDAETGFDLIKSMLCMEPEERPQIYEVLASSFFSNQEQVKFPISEIRKVQLMKESITYNPKKIIHHDFPRGHIVFSGFMSKNQVAINRITTNEIDIETMKRAASSLRHISNINQFVIRFLDMGFSPKFYKFIVTELWEATLEDYVEGLYKGPKFKDDREILLAITNGLHFFHCKLKVAHGNIRPKTILICPSSESVAGNMTVKLADTITSACNQESESKRSKNNRMTFRWRGHAENLLPSEDILPLGCVFAYTLEIGGKNCFGGDIIAKIQTAKRKKLTNSEKSKASGTILTLIQTMMNRDPENRPTAAELLNHDFFLGCKNSLGSFSSNELDVKEVGCIDNVSQYLKGLQLLEESPKDPQSISFKSNAEDKKDARLEEELFNLCSLPEPTDLEIDQLAQLVKNNADLDLNKSNREGFTPLELLCKNNKSLKLKQCIQILIIGSTNKLDTNNRGGNVEQGRINQKYLNGSRALKYVCKYYTNDDFLEIIDMLIKHCFGFNRAEIKRQLSDSNLELVSHKHQHSYEESGVCPRDSKLSFQRFKSLREKRGKMRENSPISSHVKGEKEGNNALDDGSRNPLHWLLKFYKGKDILVIVKKILEKRH